MFTIKLYNGGRQRILSAESFTILRSDTEDNKGAEITLHQKNPSDDRRYDVTNVNSPIGFPERFDRAIIENAAGKTTEIISIGCPG